MNKKIFWTNNPVFIFQFIVLPLGSSICLLLFDLFSFLVVVFSFLMLDIALLYSHRVVFDHKFVYGPGKLRVIHSVKILIEKAEFRFEKKPLFCRHLVIHEGDSDKEIHVACPDFTNSTIIEITRFIEEKKLKLNNE